jgi:plastocyanin
MLAFREPPLMKGAAVYAAAFLVLLTLIGGMAWAASSISQYQVSQTGRDFQPKQITMRRGETLQIVNDDADLLHHAYVSSDQFNFDSGDMEPGSKINVTFPVAGEFNVLCGIHPKMKLRVRVD